MLKYGLFFLSSLWIAFTQALYASEIARFQVTNQVVAPNIPAFTATINAVGNGAHLSRNSSFEPKVIRTMLRVQSTENRFVRLSPQQASNYSSWRQGALDGANVEVLRLENGAFQSVLKTRIAVGGHLASGFLAQFGGKALPASQRSVKVGRTKWSRPDAPSYFTVRAIDRRGRLSEAAAEIEVSFAGSARPPQPKNLQSLKITPTPSKRLTRPDQLQAQPLDDGSVRLSWKPVRGAAGYLIYETEYPPSQRYGWGLRLENTSVALQTGDLLKISSTIWRPERALLVDNRLWNAVQATKQFRPALVSSWPNDPAQARWKLRPYTGSGSEGLPQELAIQGGQAFLEAQLQTDRHIKLGLYNTSGVDQDWYPVLDPNDDYILEIWLRGEAGSTAEIVTGRSEKIILEGKTRFPLSPHWQKHRLRFRSAALLTGNRPEWMGVILRGSGKVAADNLRIYRADTTYLDWLPEDLAALQSSGMGALRTHAFVKTRTQSYNLEQLTNPAGANSSSNGNTLPQTLAAIQKAGMQPWLQIEPHFSSEEWLGLAEYLAAPFDPAIDSAASKPWAAKRYYQGQKQPYTATFDTLMLEVGNETWNSLFRPWVFKPMVDAGTGRKYGRGAVYGIYQNYVLRQLKQSPYWPALASVLRPVIGGWAINNYGQEAAGLSPETPLVTVAAYNGGWDEKEGVVAPTNGGYASLLSFVPQVTIERADTQMQATVAAASNRGQPLAMGTYEAGPGYAKNGLNKQRVTKEQAALQEQVMKSAAAGTATLDVFMAQARAGFQVQNYFTFGRGEEWRSHAKPYRGGQAYPSWQWLALLNREGKGPGDMLRVDALETPRRNLPALGRRDARRNAPMVDVYPLLQGDQLIVAVVSRLVANVPIGTKGITQVSIELPFNTAQSLELVSMTGNMTSTNTDSPQAVLTTEPLDHQLQLPVLKIDQLNPGETLVFIFDKVGI